MNASLAMRLQAILAAALVSFAPAAHADLAKGLAAGTEKDLVQAYAWFNFAAASGNEDARRNKQLAASKMSPEQIASGKQLVQDGPSPLAAAPRLAALDAPPCKMTTADAHPDIKWVDDLSCLLEADSRNIDTSTVEVATYMTSGQYEFVRECRVGEDVLRVFRDKGRNRPHLGSPQHGIERYSYIVIRTSPKETGHHFHEVSEKAHWARRIKACRTP